MHQIENSIFIAAPPSKVWAIITDFDSYGKWNTFITAVKSSTPPSETKEGSTNTITVAPSTPGGKPAEYHNTISVFEPGREMRWWGTLAHSAVFRAEHWCLLEEATSADGVTGTRLTQGERFTGVLIPVVSLTGAFKDLNDGHVRMNGDLKRYAEGAE